MAQIDAIIDRIGNTEPLKAAIGDGFFDGGTKFALFQYWGAHRIVKLAMKRGDARALRELELWVRGTLPALEKWLQSSNCRYVVAPPGHVANSVQSLAIDRLCHVIVDVLPAM